MEQYIYVYRPYFVPVQGLSVGFWLAPDTWQSSSTKRLNISEMAIIIWMFPSRRSYKYSSTRMFPGSSLYSSICNKHWSNDKIF